MNEDYTKGRFKCKKVSFIAPLLNKMHTDPHIFLFGFKLRYVSRYLKKIRLSKSLIQKIWGVTYLSGQRSRLTLPCVTIRNF